MEAHITSMPSLLLITYLRFDHLERILDSSYGAGIRNFFVVMDGLKSNASTQERSAAERVRTSIGKWRESRQDVSFEILEMSINIGCSASVLRGLDWVSNNAKSFIVLEDDCLPSSDFFLFCQDALEYLQVNPDVMLACGSQFAPQELTLNTWHLSSYALTWGWITTSEKWHRLRILIRENHKEVDSFSLSLFERSYWAAGSRRARDGYTDVWDTLLVHTLLQNKLKALLPGSSLISNAGNDVFATHTKNDSEWLNSSIFKYAKRFDEYPKTNDAVDLWLRKTFFKIRPRHLITNLATRILDQSGFYKRKVPPLDVRWP